MRTLVDILEQDIDALDREAEREGVSRAAVIRRAISEFLANRSSGGVDEAFGLWSSGVDGLAFQERMRREW